MPLRRVTLAGRDLMTVRAYVRYVMEHGDAAMREKSRDTIQVLGMLKQGQRIPL